MSKFNSQQGRCYYTDVELDPSKLGTRSLCLPSLDRVDNTLGYTPENTRLTSLGWNQLRNISSIEDTLLFISRCKLNV